MLPRSCTSFPSFCDRGWSEISSSTRRSLGSYLVDGEPDQDRRDGHEADHGRDDGGQERGPVDALYAYPHQDYHGVGKGKSPQYGYPCEYEDRCGVGRHAVDLRKARHLPDEGPYGKQVDPRYHADPDRRE